MLGKYFIQGINVTTIYAEEMYTPNFTVYGKKICLSLQYNSDDSYLFVNGRQIVNFKAKDFEIVPYPLCLAGISKDFSSSNATGLYDMFMTLVSIIKPLQMKKYKILTDI